MAISLCLMGTLLAVYNAFFFSQAPPEQALRLVVRNRVSPAVSMPIAYREKIRGIAGVREVMPFQFFGGVYKERKNVFARYAVEPARVFIIRPEYKVPQEQKLAFLRDRTGCLIGAGLARRYNLKLGDRVTLKGDIFPVTVDLTVRAIYENPQDPELLFFNINYLFELLPAYRRDRAIAFSVLAESPESVTRVARAIDATFRNATIRTRTEAERAFTLTFLSMLGNIKAFLISVCAALTFTMLLVSANTMAMAARERVREVGVLKTLGFSQQAILGMIVGEAAVLSLAGGIIGCGFAWLMTYGVRKLPALIVQFASLSLEPLLALIVISIGILIGILSSAVPAWLAARTPILQALKFTD